MSHQLSGPRLRSHTRVDTGTIEDHLSDCLEELKLRQNTSKVTKTDTFTKFLCTLFTSSFLHSPAAVPAGAGVRKREKKNKIQKGGFSGKDDEMKKMSFALAICALIAGWCIVSFVENGLLSPHTPVILAPS